jgi:hypothetical protein
MRHTSKVLFGEILTSLGAHDSLNTEGVMMLTGFIYLRMQSSRGLYFV